MPPFPGPPSLVTAGQPVEASDRGGCPSVYYLTRMVAADDCGPHTFALTAEAQQVVRGGTLQVIAPAGWSYSQEAIRTTREAVSHETWTLTIALIDALTALPMGQQESIPSAAGTVLAHGNDSTDADAVAPSEPGEYLLQLRADVSRDGWTWIGDLYFWRISVRSITVTDRFGHPAEVVVADGQSLLTVAEPASAAEALRGESELGIADLSLVSLEPRRAVLTWIGTVCDKVVHISVTSGQIEVSPDPRPGCDLGIDPRSTVLVFREAVDVGQVQLRLLPVRLIAGMG